MTSFDALNLEISSCSRALRISCSNSSSSSIHHADAGAGFATVLRVAFGNIPLRYEVGALCLSVKASQSPPHSMREDSGGGPSQTPPTVKLDRLKSRLKIHSNRAILVLLLNWANTCHQRKCAVTVANPFTTRCLQAHTNFKNVSLHSLVLMPADWSLSNE